MQEERNKKKPLPKDEEGRDLFDETFAVASTMECTGLIPAAPESTEEVDSYSEIYDIPLTKDKKAADNHLQDERKINSPQF